MECKLSVSGDYIVIKFNTPITAELARKYGAEIVALSKKHKIKKFLFDMRKSPNVDGVFANYEFAHKDIFEFGFPLDSYSAFLVHPHDHSHDFITVAFEKAGFKVKIFDEEESALNWLRIKGGDS